jgi:hypothetical protein
MQSLLSRVPTNGGQASATPIVTGQRIAKATINYAPQQRAADAARWLRGELSIKPTVALAARTFGVSVPLVVEAHERLEQSERAKRFGNGGTAILSDSAIEKLVREVGVDRVWRVVDKLTSPELSLVAAE